MEVYLSRGSDSNRVIDHTRHKHVLYIKIYYYQTSYLVASLSPSLVPIRTVGLCTNVIPLQECLV